MFKLIFALGIIFAALIWSADWEAQWNPQITSALNRLESSDFSEHLKSLNIDELWARVRNPASTPIDAPASDPLRSIDSMSSAVTARVTRVIDGDSIEVNLDGEAVQVRYIGVNTPEYGDACFQEASLANRRLVDRQTVTLVRDVSETDQYGRLLRYVYVGDTFVNEALVVNGYAEAVLYDPDYRHYDAFRDLEEAARRMNRGCHMTGIFDDGSLIR